MNMVCLWLPPRVLLLATLGALLASVVLYRQGTDAQCDLDIGNMTATSTCPGRSFLSVMRRPTRNAFPPLPVTATSSCHHPDSLSSSAPRSIKAFCLASPCLLRFILTLFTGSSRASLGTFLPPACHPSRSLGSARSRASRPTMLPPP